MFFNLKHFIKCVFVIYYLCVGNAQAHEFFSSMNGLESLLKTEEILAHDFRFYVESMRRKINALESELIKIEEQQKLASENIEDYLTNPINVYLLIKRLYSDWYSYEERIRNDNIGGDFLHRLQWLKDTMDFPSEQDMYGAALALMRLQSTYKLDVDDVAAGILNGIHYRTKMSWHDCYELGRQLHGAEEYNYTKLWLRQSVRLLDKESFSQEPMALDFMETVAESLLSLGDSVTAYKLSSKIVNLDAERVKAWDIAYKAENMLRNGQEVALTEKVKDDYYLTNEYENYKKLCRGEVLLSTHQKSSLHCRLATNGHPYRLLMPFKVEEHNLDPLIMTIHDVFLPKKADIVRKMAMPLLERSSVRGSTGISDVRVSKNAWLEYQSHPYMMDILRDLHDMTGLDMSLCEELQVANYGLGGHYEPHWDFFLSHELSMIPEGEGNRIATAIFYLSDVEQGGATVFPHLNVTVWPRKGSVLFWYNLHRSLDGDYRTRHAGCPVLKGSKWIANVWINDITQTFTRPCASQSDHEISLPYQIVE